MALVHNAGLAERVERLRFLSQENKEALASKLRVADQNDQRDVLEALERVDRLESFGAHEKAKRIGDVANSSLSTLVRVAEELEALDRLLGLKSNIYASVGVSLVMSHGIAVIHDDGRITYQSNFVDSRVSEGSWPSGVRSLDTTYPVAFHPSKDVVAVEIGKAAIRVGRVGGGALLDASLPSLSAAEDRLDYEVECEAVEGTDFADVRVVPPATGVDFSSHRFLTAADVLRAFLSSTVI